MGDRTTKKQGNKSGAAPENVRKDNGKTMSSYQFKDNRPEAVSQRKLQGMANDYADRQDIPMQRKENNTGLPDNLKSGIENLSGQSMDDVKVHYNSDKPAQLNAHAYAQGTNIHLGSGQEKHLPHEAWHVVQQKQGRVRPTMQMKGKVNVNDDPGLEKEADVMGAKALQMKSNTTSDPLIQLMLTDPLLANVIIQGKFEMDPQLVTQLSAVVQMNGWEKFEAVGEVIDFLLTNIMGAIILVEAIRDEAHEGIAPSTFWSLAVVAALATLNSILGAIAQLKNAKSKAQTALAVAKLVATIGILIPIIVILSEYGVAASSFGALLASFIALKDALFAAPALVTKVKFAFKKPGINDSTALLGDQEMTDIATL